MHVNDFRPASMIANIEGTNDSATLCKLSAVKKGYYEDTFLSCLAKLLLRERSTRETTDLFDLQYQRHNKSLSEVNLFSKLHFSPLLHRGYFTRVYSIFERVKKFLNHGEIQRKKQILSLGAGYDTLYWRLRQKGYHFDKLLEVDLEGVTKSKREAILSAEHLLGFLEDVVVASTGHELFSKFYDLINGDLRNSQEIIKKITKLLLLNEDGERNKAPVEVLIIAECVLIYLPVKDSSRLLTDLVSLFKEYGASVTIIIYEQVRPYDAFGQVMASNFRSQNYPLLSLESLPSLESQENRLKKSGFAYAEAADLRSVYERIPAQELEKVSSIEPLDEIEEWNLLMEHYCLACASTDQSLFNSIKP